tara:strand:+ start:1368 stop:1634 length:267 start_codon:yes stop_codon:yes gene_type:complete
MTITAAIVLFAIIWFMVLFICLPLRIKTQSESGNIVPGTPGSAPENGDLKGKIKLVTIISCFLWIALFGIIISGIFQIEDIDMFSVFQ